MTMPTIHKILATTALCLAAMGAQTNYQRVKSYEACN